MKYLLRQDVYNSRFKWKNDGFRTLYESVIHPDIFVCLDDLKKYDKSNNVLIGGLALSYYLKPRETQDIDLIFLTENDIPRYIQSFKRVRNHAFLHLKTHVEVEVLSPQFLNIDENIVNIVFKDSKKVDGINIASPVSLIVLKLKRFNDRDQLDIKELIQYCNDNKIKIDIEKYNLPDDYIKNFNSINTETQYNENMYILESNFSLKNSKYEKISENDFDIYIFNEKFGEPRFHLFSKDKKIRYCIELNNLEIVDSYHDYKSFILDESLGKKIKEYYLMNKTKIKKIWDELNN